MKTYLELCENLCDYLYLDDNKAFKDVDKRKLNLAVASINGDKIFSISEKRQFIKMCSMKIINLLLSPKLKGHRLYLLANIKVYDVNSKISDYKKVWKIVQNHIDISNFVLGPEIKFILETGVNWFSIAEVNLHQIDQVLNLISEDAKNFMLIASKNENMLTCDSIKEIFYYSFVEYNKKNMSIDYFNLSTKLCKKGDVIFRWGSDSESVELDLIFDNNYLRCKELGKYLEM